MKVQVTKILAQKPKSRVLCATDYGFVSLFWVGANPIISKTYDVELEASQILQSNDITVSHSDVCVLTDDYGGVKIIGDIDSIDDDGYITLRLDNYIISFMTKGIVPQVGNRVKIVVKVMSAYPIDEL